MEIDMKQWAALVTLGLVLVAAWALPPSRLGIQRPAALPEVRRYDALAREARRDVGVLLSTRWSDSLSEVTVRTAVDGLAAGAFVSEEVTAGDYADWVARLREQSRSLQPRDERLVLGVYVQSAYQGRPEGLPAPAGGSSGVYAGVRDGTPYCMLVDRQALPLPARALRYRTDFGPCRLYAKYGWPGPRIERWLEAGGMRFAAAERRPQETPQYIRSWIEEVDSPVFGLKRIPLVDEDPTGGRCLAGDAASCAALIAGREATYWDVSNYWDGSDAAYVVANSPLTYTPRVGAAAQRFGPSPYFLADLEDEFGTDAFARFWASDEDLPQAFEAAFGVELGDWALDWMQAEVGVHRAGPGLQAGTPLFVLLTIMALAALVSLVAVRRRVA